MSAETLNNKLLALAIGRRKKSVAIVQIYSLDNNQPSEILINNVIADVFLQFNPHYINSFKTSLALLNLTQSFKINIKTRGGGLSGQTGAIKLGLSRALYKIDSNYRPLFKTAGLLTRDPRSVERKKYGLKKARKASQYSKR
jgi:small subunit ribosomal protein S9